MGVFRSILHVTVFHLDPPRSSSSTDRFPHSARRRRIILMCSFLWLGTLTLQPQWIRTDEPNGSILQCITAAGGALLVGTADLGVYRSIGDGSSWAPVNNGLNNTHVRTLASTGSDGVFLSTDSGANWMAFNAGLGSGPVWALATDQEAIFAGGAAVWSRKQSDVTTSFRQSPVDVPTGFGPEQIDPNPFNSSTTIRFCVPRGGIVTLKVYDLMGREAATLVDEEMVPGSYEASFDAGGLTSGVFVYPLRTVA